jgi:DNA polymerase III delta subunit
MVFELFSIDRPWNKIKPIIEEARKQLNQQELYEYFEYLYNEHQKRKQKLQRSTA